MQEVLVAMDIGGTHIRILKNQDKIVLKTADFSCFSDVLERFVSPTTTTKVVCALAGPIDAEGGVSPPNIKQWGRIDPHSLVKKFPLLKIQFINDLVAHAHGLDFVGQKDLHLLKKGSGSDGKKVLLIAPGTGLGMAFKNGKQVYPTEAGHIDWPVYGINSAKVYSILHKKYGHVSYERIVSGIGLDELGEILQVEDVMPLFFQNLARFIANMTLAFLPETIYLGGGILHHHLKNFDAALFSEALFDQGRFKDIVNRPSIYIVKDELTALKGAASLLF